MEDEKHEQEFTETERNPRFDGRDSPAFPSSSTDSPRVVMEYPNSATGKRGDIPEATGDESAAVNADGGYDSDEPIVFEEGEEICLDDISSLALEAFQDSRPAEEREEAARRQRVGDWISPAVRSESPLRAPLKKRENVVSPGKVDVGSQRVQNRIPKESNEEYVNLFIATYLICRLFSPPLSYPHGSWICFDRNGRGCKKWNTAFQNICSHCGRGVTYERTKIEMKSVYRFSLCVYDSHPG